MASETDELDPLPPGFRLGEYLIEAELGEGPMGMVYRAHADALRETVAVYVLRRSQRSGEHRHRFWRWARDATLGQQEVALPCQGASLPIVEVALVNGIDFAVLTYTNRTD